MRYLALLLAFGLAASSALAQDLVVKVGHNRLEPAELTVAAGKSVSFVNEDEMPGGHTLVADDGSFESPPLKKGETWSHVFAKPGTYGYSIKQHPTAKGRIVVQ
jgi:plastocyanin